MVSTGLSNKDKQERVKNLPTTIKNETDALTALSKSLNQIMKTKDTKELKNKSTPLTGIQSSYDTKTEVTENFSKLFKYINLQQS